MMTATTDRALTTFEQKLEEEFSRRENLVNGSRNSVIHQKRIEAMASFRKMGLPTRKTEDWKYTSLKEAADTNWNLNPEPVNVSTNMLTASVPAEVVSNLLVFVNGHFSEDLSRIIDKEGGIVIKPLSSAIIENRELVESHFGRYADVNLSAMTAVNTAFATEGAFIYFPQNTFISRPIHLLFIQTKEAAAALHIRNLVIAEKHANVRLIEETVSSDEKSLLTVVTEIAVEESAVVDHYKLQLDGRQSTQVNITQIHQRESSVCSNTTITLGGKLIRNDLNFTLAGKHCESRLNGVYISSGEQHIDNHTFVDHAVAECNSDEFYKGVIMDRSTSVFNGKILVRPDAQKTNAYQSNRNVLLSPEGKIDTKPQLEIFADDVKCSHGATVGQLDEEALFYLQSRAIGETDARAMLTLAFAQDVVDRIQYPELREFISMKVQEKLAG